VQVYVGVPAPKRLKVDEKMAGGREPPKKLLIEEGDDERTKERKRKLLKAFKTKQRLADKEAEQNAKASSWQAFRNSKGATKHKPGCVARRPPVAACLPSHRALMRTLLLALPQLFDQGGQGKHVRGARGRPRGRHRQRQGRHRRAGAPKAPVLSARRRAPQRGRLALP